MQRWIGVGRLTKDPETVYTQDQMAISKYTLAIDRPGKDKGTDFIPVKGLGKVGEFIEKYLRKGMKIIVEGYIQTGSYKDKDGNVRYTWEVLATSHEFCEKRAEQPASTTQVSGTIDEGFMDIPEGIENELPFN